MDSSNPVVCFSELGLVDAVQAAVSQKGYTTPTPIQAGTIPFLLEGRDVLGQASTGTGKTAAFALPLLSRLDASSRQTQVLVLTPTRELAIQVAASFTNYGRLIPQLNVQAIYGGASYVGQIRELKRGAQVVVGTPGRIMDHLRRGVMDLSGLKCIVLDEADEMLRMGFVEDVRWILEQTPEGRQCALFSATMPAPIRKIADEHLKSPAVVTIREETAVAAGIRSRVLFTSHRDKTQALVRILESEETDGVIVFVKTRETTVRVAEELQDRGFTSIALNGDIPQKQREQTIQQLRSGRLDVLVATDVAARGLDVDRISHVINYDMPHDSESWVHRIGRTGRAGRQGEAILLLPFHERRRLQYLERATGQTISEMQYPGAGAVNARRIQKLKQQLTEALQSPQINSLRSLLKDLQAETNAAAEDLTAAAIVVMNNDRPFLMEEEPRRARQRENGAGDRRERAGREQGRRDFRAEREGRGERGNQWQRNDGERRPEAGRFAAQRPARVADHQATTQAVAQNEITPARTVTRDDHRSHADVRPQTDVRTEQDRPRRERRPDRVEHGMERFRVEVGHEHGVMPGNLVGAIANEIGMDSKNIGRIQIMDDHSFVDMPEGMPRAIFRQLKEVVVLGRHLRISRAEEVVRGGFGRRPQGAGGGGARTGRPAHRPAGRGKPPQARTGGPRRNVRPAGKPAGARRHAD
ncbi:MAG: DEAD/DEAH box helicase [Planctomycetaceae bacterium]|nr:DEAD/DEAH box helicase [Planctomycetaceae bacterium]